MWHDFFFIALNWMTSSWLTFGIVIAVLVVIGALLVWWAQKTDGITYVLVVYFILAVAIILVLVMIQNGVVEVPSVVELVKR